MRPARDARAEFLRRLSEIGFPAPISAISEGVGKMANVASRGGANPSLLLAIHRTQCYISHMIDAEGPTRTFKTAWFTKAARKARIGDDELCDAIEEVRKGQADDLGGGVFKKRLNKNMHRSIILAKSGRYWVYEFLFAKKDRANINDADLEDFRTLAKIYATLSDNQLAQLVADNDMTEICNGDEAKI